MASGALASLFPQRVVVGVADLGVSNNVSITLSTYALGSCIGVAAYDPIAKVGGLLHLMLPDSAISPQKAQGQPAMFVDTGMPLLLQSLAGLRAERSRLRIFIAGGAAVLCGADAFRIGDKNIRATLDCLARQGLTARHTAIGGTINRTVHLEVGSGSITLKTPTANDKFSLGL
jgi:chemotaxis protein CheD